MDSRGSVVEFWVTGFGHTLSLVSPEACNRGGPSHRTQTEARSSLLTKHSPLFVRQRSAPAGPNQKDFPASQACPWKPSRRGRLGWACAPIARQVSPGRTGSPQVGCSGSCCFPIPSVKVTHVRKLVPCTELCARLLLLHLPGGWREILSPA